MCLFIDEERYLPLRVDLLDKNNDVIEQFRVITANQNKEIISELDSLNKVNMPPLLLIPKATQALNYNWRVTTLPEGFKEVKRSNHQIAEMNLVNLFYIVTAYSISPFMLTKVVSN